MTLREITRNAITRLTPIYGSGEAQWLLRIIWQQLKGYSTTDTALKADDEISSFIAGKVEAVTDRLLRNEPIQYIFGSTSFYGLTISVNPSVLIPRPETEQLVDIIIKHAGTTPDLQVLDLCTGSGCIALALARNLMFPHITATDISPEAIATARSNAGSLHVKINFLISDLLAPQPLPGTGYDIIVSNPPYIARQESTGMCRNVLDYEPHTALFVPDDNPLLFYHAIAEKALNALHPGGSLYLEINPRFDRQLIQLLTDRGYTDIDLIRDSFGINRFISAQKPTE